MPKTEWDNIDAATAARARAATLQREADALRRKQTNPTLVEDDEFEDADELTIDDSRDKEG